MRRLAILLARHTRMRGSAMRQLPKRRSSVRRRVALLLVAAMAAAVFASSATATPPPMKFSDTATLTSELTDVCPFPVMVESTITFTEIHFLDESGNVTRIVNHTVEQDVFSANGKSLTGIPFAFNIQVLFDEEGAVTHVYASGVAEKILLPDGTLFISAGRLDFTAHPGAVFVLSPDVGNPGNVEAFCAALADP